MKVMCDSGNNAFSITKKLHKFSDGNIKWFGDKTFLQRQKFREVLDGLKRKEEAGESDWTFEYKFDAPRGVK